MNTKTPYNPSKSATKRVKNALPIPTDCNCCYDFETGEFVVPAILEEISVWLEVG